MDASGWELRGGLVVDGTGAPGRGGPVRIMGGRVVGAFPDGVEPTVIDATGCIIAPGFIDVHANQTWGPLSDPGVPLLVQQGTTTAVTGNCGGSLFPLGGSATEWADNIGRDHGLERTWDDLPGYARALGATAVDLVPLAGHAMVRSSVGAPRSEPADRPTMAAVARAARACLDEGANGISFGLAYPPGAFAPDEELELVCREAAAAGTPVAFHIRNESSAVVEAVREVLGLAARTGARTIICHHKVLGRPFRGATVETLALVAAARVESSDVRFDLYPYTSAMRNLLMVLPDDHHRGGRAALVERFRDPARRGELGEAMLRTAEEWGAAWEDTRIVDAPATPELEGRRADEVIGELGIAGLVDAVAANAGRVMTQYDGASWEDLGRVVLDPFTMVGSDGDAQLPVEGMHPRAGATMPAFLREVVVDRQILDLPEAVRRMTGLAAETFGLADRGQLAPGRRADVCVFPDPAGEPPPRRDPDGWVRHLFVAGEPVVRDGGPTGALPGRVLLRGSDG